MAMGKTTKPRNANSKITARALNQDDWPVVEKLFGSNGACGGCWCMYWRLPRGGKLWEENKGAKNKRAFKRLVTQGKVRGCLAFEGDEPVGWCCVGPRGDFPRLERTKALTTEWSETTWSVVCFYIRSGWRRCGVATALLKRAVAVARSGGATELEGYPLRAKNAAHDIPAAFAWTGVEPIFEGERFVTITPPGQSRDVYRRHFRQPRPKPR